MSDGVDGWSGVDTPQTVTTTRAPAVLTILTIIGQDGLVNNNVNNATVTIDNTHDHWSGWSLRQRECSKRFLNIQGGLTSIYMKNLKFRTIINDYAKIMYTMQMTNYNTRCSVETGT